MRTHCAPQVSKLRVCTPGADEQPRPRASRAAMTWMQRLRRVYGIDVSMCSFTHLEANATSRREQMSPAYEPWPQVAVTYSIQATRTGL